MSGTPKIPGEETLMDAITSDNQKLVLTTHRVRLLSRSWGSSSMKSIMLEDVCYCGAIRQSRPLCLVIAVLALVIGVGLLLSNQAGPQFAVPVLVVALAFGVAYMTSHYAALGIRSANGDITVSLKETSIEDFINTLEMAKHTWLKHLEEK